MRGSLQFRWSCTRRGGVALGLTVLVRFMETRFEAPVMLQRTVYVPVNRLSSKFCRICRFWGADLQKSLMKVEKATFRVQPVQYLAFTST
jgi:hypothetical protein